MHRAGDYIGDCLRFPGPRWPLNDEVFAGSHHFDREGLRTISINNMNQIGRLETLVNLFAVGEQWLFGSKTFDQQCTNKRMIEDSFLRPCIAVEIVKHQELGERKEA